MVGGLTVFFVKDLIHVAKLLYFSISFQLFYKVKNECRKHATRQCIFLERIILTYPAARFIVIPCQHMRGIGPPLTIKAVSALSIMSQSPEAPCWYIVGINSFFLFFMSC